MEWSGLEGRFRAQDLSSFRVNNKITGSVKEQGMAVCEAYGADVCSWLQRLQDEKLRARSPPTPLSRILEVSPRISVALAHKLVIISVSSNICGLKAFGRCGPRQT